MSRTSLTDTGHSRLFFFSYSKKCLPVQNEFTNVVMNVLYKKPFFFSIAGQCTFWQTKKKKEEEITGASLFQDCVPVMTCSFVQQWRNFVHLFWWSWMDNENLFSYVMLELSKPQPPEELMDLLVLLYEFQNPRLTAEVLASIRTIRLTNIRMTSLKCFVLSSVLSCASPR